MIVGIVGIVGIAGIAGIAGIVGIPAGSSPAVRGQPKAARTSAAWASGFTSGQMCSIRPVLPM